MYVIYNVMYVCAFICANILYVYVYVYVYVCACTNSFNTQRSYLEGPVDFYVLIQGIHWGVEMAHWQFSDDVEQELWDVLGSNPALHP